MAAWRHAARQLGFTMSEEYLQKTRGLNVNDAIALFSEYFDTAHTYQEVRRIRTVVAEDLIAKTEGAALLKPFAREALDELDRMGIPKAVATSTEKSKNEAHLRHADLLGRFPVMIAGDMVTNGKPNPDIFLAAAAQLGADPADCVVVEDSPAGIEAAFRAGMRSVLIPDCVKPDAKTLERANARLSSLEELPGILKTWMEE